eukprot:766826-Prymnesium_polylepis.1
MHTASKAVGRSSTAPAGSPVIRITLPPVGRPPKGSEERACHSQRGGEGGGGVSGGEGGGMG